MAYSPVPTMVTGDLWPAAYENTYVRDNFAAGVPDIFTTKGDMAVASGADAAGRLPAGSDGQTIVLDSAQPLGMKYVWGLIPVGGIIIWSGSIVSIPTGFALCNGAGGTPDLRDKFVVGAGAAYAPGDAGGATTHTHTQGNVGAEAAHTHTQGNTGAEAAHTHTQGNTGAEAAHTHSYSGNVDAALGTSLVATGAIQTASYTHFHAFAGTTGAGSSHVHTNPTTAAGASHVHTNPTTAAGASHVHTNPTTAAGSSLPPYYALAYIMRTS